tara:strand:- start:5421 stop:6092 length:672 start_codon:yes stop_codon:yes gene_type:complete
MKQTKAKRQYAVHKIFGSTIQGEGAMAGVPCVFVRFSGCNMWDGRPETRGESKCPFCDTDFFHGDLLTIKDIVDQVNSLSRTGVGWVWFSGGEPSLQLDKPLTVALKQQGFKIGVETNGTRVFKEGTLSNVDHLVMSPKLPVEQTKQRWCNSLKVLFPHPNPKIRPENYHPIRCETRWIQPVDSEHPIKNKQNVEDTIEHLFKLPSSYDWRLSVQTHKYIGVE